MPTSTGAPRPRKRLPGFLSALLVASASLVLAAPAAGAGPRIFQTGVTNIEDEVPVAFHRTREAGAHFVRIPLYWAAIAPRTPPGAWEPTDPSDPNYDWDQVDRSVAAAVAAGLAPVLTVDGGPHWAQRCTAPDFARVDMCDTSPSALAEFATAAARHFSGRVPGIPRVQYWQGLNEPNLSLFFNPQYGADGRLVSPDLYRTLINAFYDAVKSVDSSNLVLTAGMGPIEVQPWTIGPLLFTRKLLCMRGRRNPRPEAGDCGGGVKFDIFATQPYTTGAPTHEGKANDIELGDLDKLQMLIRAADRAGRIHGSFKRTPVWITEFSWDTNPPDPGGLDMRIATRWTAEALYQAWRARITHFFWYSLQDGPRGGGRPFSETLESGLYFRGPTVEEDQPKDILLAFRFPFVAYPARRGLRVWGRTPTSTPGRVAIQIWKGGRWRTASRLRASRAGVFNGLIPLRYGRKKRGFARAAYAGQISPSFSMRPVKDFYQEPFG